MYRDEIITPHTLRGLNTTSEGVCSCLRTTYWKVSLANFLHSDGRAVTGVEVVYET